MYAIYNTKTNIIRTVVSTAEQNLQTILSSDETYQKYPANASVRKGYNIKRFDNQGGLRPVSEQIEMNIIPLDELYELEGFHYKAMEDTAKQEKGNDITLLKEQATLQSIQRSIQASGGTPKYSSSLPEKTEVNSLPQETTVVELVAKKESEVKELKEQYLDADIDDNEPLKTDLKAQIQELKKEIALLKEDVENE